MKQPLDLQILFLTRMLRLFGYGLLSVILVIYLAEKGLSEAKIGLLIGLTLIGDVAVSLWIILNADRFGRKRMLALSSLLIVLAGILFILTDNFTLLLIAAVIGVISPSGNEVGPFLAIEQASLSQITPDRSRTKIFAWYHLCGFFATAAGSLCAGFMLHFFSSQGLSMTKSYQSVIVFYAIIGLLLGIFFMSLSSQIETQPNNQAKVTQTYFGLHKSRIKIFKLSSLFALDAFGGGFILQSIIAYWFYIRFQIDPVILGSVFFGMNVLAGFSGLLAARIASRIGLINTMVFTHLPSNFLLILVPFMPSLPLAISVLLLRSVISQMDVPTRQSYTMAVVHPDERSAAAGIANIARTLGASASSAFAMPLLAQASLLSAPFFLAGSIKILYDVMLFQQFKTIKPPEEAGNFAMVNEHLKVHQK
jgi:MFS family permease